MSSKDRIIGIDLGTTNSVVAIIEDDEAQIIKNAEGQAKTPSTVAFLESGENLIGEIARRQSAAQPERTISSAKRLLGRLKHELDEEEEVYPFETGEDPEGRVTVIIDDQPFLPEQISALILEKLKAEAEEYLGETVDKAVITVPAYFDDVQRQATLEAAKLAGLDVLRLINEPTAAAMAYGLSKSCQETVAIYDFGGGTFDFSVLDIIDNTFEVLTTTGNSRLGGDDLDMALVDYISDQFLEEHGVDLRDDILTFRRLKDEMERVKCELSTATQAMLSLPFITYKDGAPLHLEQRISREDVEDLFDPFVDETLSCCRTALREANLRKTQITKVILVGGSTRIPLVQEMVGDYFGMDPFRGVNPDEVVAIGAAMQGAVLAGDLEEVVLLDVTPHTLAIEVKGDRCSPLVDKNSTIPIKVARFFTTSEDDQNFVNVHLLQGEEAKASDNRSLGKFTLSGIPEASAGQPRIRVEIFVNADGVVEVSATETDTENVQTLTASYGHLNADERRARQGLSNRKERRRRRRDRQTNGAPARNGSSSKKPIPPISPTPKKSAPVEANVPEGITEDEPMVMESGPAAEPVAPLQPVEKNVASSAPSPGTEAKAPASRGPLPPEPSAGPIAPDLSEHDSPGIILSDEEKAATSVRKRDTGQRNSKPYPSGTPGSSGTAGTAGASGTSGTPGPKVAPPPTAAPLPELAGVARARDSQHLVASIPGDGSEVEVEAEESPTICGSAELTVAIPEALQSLIELVDAGRSDNEAAAVYKDLGSAFTKFCSEHEGDANVQLIRAKCLILSKHPEEAREAIAAMRAGWPDRKIDQVQILGLLCRLYPNYIAARRDRAVLAAEVGELSIAMADLEFIAKRDTSDTTIFDDLREVYKKVLEDTDDSTVQFKLVKMYLRRGELDDAISSLQNLVKIPEYRERADKVLGLCFWQKGLRYLAFQKFKTQPLSGEIKDILYRLSVDMEENDELLHAKYALERIYEEDIGYRETADRLKKIGYRVDLMKDERYGGSGGQSVAMNNADTINQSLLGNRFELQGEINRGSMGIVYRALDRTLDEVVALKVLNDFLVSDPEAVRRFKQEARSARKLSHPNIVRIHDFLEFEDNKKAISMEYIEGEDMKAILGRNMTFTEDMVLHYLVQICDAMTHAHKLGIIHRDIKPANIMIDERNQVKVTDFGIAKVLDSAATNNGTMIMGTPLYMSPEQIQGDKIDQRVDIYALGIMLYELVTGSPPFYEGNIDYQHIHKPVPEIAVGISDDLKAAIMRCVEKDPEKRFQSIDELKQAIVQAQER